MKPVTVTDNASTVRKTIDYIEAHLTQDLSLKRLAGGLHYSGFYLERIFRQETGLTLYQYIKRRRLTRAARELVDTRRPIVEIACDARYSSQQAFTLAFGSVYQCTPAAYRRRGVFTPAQIRLSGAGFVRGRFLFHSSSQGGKMAA